MPNVVDLLVPTTVLAAPSVVASPTSGVRYSVTQPTMTAASQSLVPPSNAELTRSSRSERLLATLAPFPRVMVVSHVNPDPDALASMFGLKALVVTASRARRSC